MSQHLLDESDFGSDEAGHRGEIQPVQQPGPPGRQAEKGSQQRRAEKDRHLSHDRAHQGVSVPAPKIRTMEASNVSSPGGTWRPMAPSTTRLIPTAAPVKMRHCRPSGMPASTGAPSAMRST